MISNQQELLQNLLQLVQTCQNSIPDLSGSLPSRHKVNTGLDSDLSKLPDVISKTISDILGSFQNFQSGSELLAEEIVGCYDRLNVAFEAITKMAQCKNTRQAIQVLIDEVGRVLKCHFCIYLGTFSSAPSSAKDIPLPEKNVLYYPTNKNNDDAREFFARHKTTLQNMPAEKNNIQVTMLDYHGEYHLDHQGRGNVLVMRLTNNDANGESFGKLIFVRRKDQELYVAHEMNLAGTLVKMGSAVLGNITKAEKLDQAYLQTVTALVRATEAKDGYTSGHSSRVALMACELARYIGLADDEVQMLERAGLLHDIGKIGIRDDVLCKPGKLTDEEFNHIKTHPLQSFKVLEPIEELQPILPAIRHHHEHFDGTGYPDGLVGENIPLHARILQVADVWDALTSTRSYRTAIKTDKAIEILQKEAGTTMDPHLVAEFLDMLKQNPTTAE